MMKDYYPDKRSLWAIKLLTIPLVAAIWAAAGIFIPFDTIVNIVRTAAVIIGVVFSFIYCPLLFRSLKYTVTDSEVKRSGGVFIKKFQSVRYSSVQYITTARSFLSQYTGLNFIVYFVYGGQLRLLFLSRSDADEIMASAPLSQAERGSGDVS
jgi:membrane protein YdbS with pleckstrin-like domain